MMELLKLNIYIIFYIITVEKSFSFFSYFKGKTEEINLAFSFNFFLYFILL
jgi:hypothetical protein